MSMFMKDQADRSWLGIKSKVVSKPQPVRRVKIRLKGVVDNATTYLLWLLAALVTMLLIGVTSLAMATEDGMKPPPEELMISPDLKAFMAINGDLIVEIWDLQ